MKRTFPYNYAHLRVRRDQLRRARGFTLLELMVVVVMIALLAAIAVPGAAKRLTSFKARQDAEAIAMLYRNARSRAMSRGGAILVRYINGVFTVREAIEGNNGLAGCNTLPETGCLLPLNRWNTNARSIQIQQYDSTGSAGDFTVTANTVHPTTSALAQPTALDVCFTPVGRSYSDITGILAPMTTAARFDVRPTVGVGFTRSVVVLPNGSTRVVAAPNIP